MNGVLTSPFTYGIWNYLIDAFLDGIVVALDAVTGPLTALLNNLFPDMTSAISYFIYFVNTYVGSVIAWFSNFVPPITRSMIGLWVTFLIVYYTVAWTYSLFIKVFNVIQKIKVW